MVNQKLLWSVLVLLSLYSRAFATDRYVDGNCSNGSAYVPATRACSGGSALVYNTANDAATAAQPGDTVYFRTGTYSSFAPNSGNSGAPITFRNYQSEVATIQGASELGPLLIDLAGKSWIVIDGLKTDGGEVGILMYGGSHDIVIQNCEVRRAYRGGIDIYGSNNVTVTNCIVTDNEQQHWPRDNGQNWASGITTSSGSTNVIVQDCYVFYNHGEGMNVYNNGSGPVTYRRNVVSDNYSVNMYVDGSDNVTYESNIIYMTAAAKALGGANNALGIGVSVESVGYTVSGLNFYNNIVVNNLAGFWAFKTESGHTYSGWLVAGNTFINNDRGIRVDNSGGTVADNIFENNVLINANLGDNAILFDTDSGGNIFRNNLYWGGTEQFNWLGSSTNFAGWVTNSGETNSSWTNPFLADYTTVPPSFWEAIRLGLIADPDAGAILDVGTSSDTTTSSGTSSSSTSSGDVSAQTVSKKGQGKTKR